ncbi:hypothetical protein BO99DRAFT_438869 [Aspergillus violaceofuscus CBS 115571]|uniref:Zn(2)-C6 fungal-type domain-containing protein n=1 Tax=Aspergillus violaceofuscus (strain CBS 115571) TaxID=1450538 RepID=A0A2V5HR21_ASPV1|nr:hypothetical protein BO99DRAFT_438869 [Aspergillus violaceofuscus CBS 115571]
MQATDYNRQQTYPFPACDSCHARKVRCNRGLPCSNCLDQGLSCQRQRIRRRLPKRILKPKVQTTSPATTTVQTLAPSRVEPVALTETDIPIELSGLQQESSVHSGEIETSNTPAIRLETKSRSIDQRVPVGCDLTAWVPLNRSIETRFMIPGHMGHFEHGLVCKAQEVLRSALFCATHAPQGSSTPLKDERGVPLEFLTWMLQDIGSTKFGIYVSDYFKHVSKTTLKRMCLRLLSNHVSNDERHIFSVCVHAAAHKFLMTVLMIGEHDDELADHLRIRSAEYKRAAQAALERIRLTITPSISLLQALLCGVFLHQGSGNTHFCYELTRTACRIATDLGLDKVSPDTEQKSRTEEEIFCVLWCYTLDKNYAWKFEPSRTFFEIEPGMLDDHVDGTAADLLAVYIAMARVQDDTLSLLKHILSNSSHSVQLPPRCSVESLLQRVDEIEQHIEQVSASSTQCWKGLDAENEIAALRFAHHSIRTTILYLSDQFQGRAFGSRDLLLQSARQELSSLLSICLINEKDRAVGFLHWTLTFYPLTACFVLFCNAVTTSNLGDLNLLKMAATFLLPSVSSSHPVTVIQHLFEEFIALSQSLFSGTESRGGMVDESGDASTLIEVQPSQPHNQPFPTGDPISTAQNPGTTVWADTTTTPFPSEFSESLTPHERNVYPAFVDPSIAIPLDFEFPADFADFVPVTSAQ